MLTMSMLPNQPVLEEANSVKKASDMMRALADRSAFELKTGAKRITSGSRFASAAGEDLPIMPDDINSKERRPYYKTAPEAFQAA
ncbi:MAG: hypothetical protein K2Y32_16465 [Candidatus Obscuribacterales bacterium]|nr:hypothetical protein [Candidatus Obscuribacterales bacterium]